MNTITLGKLADLVQGQVHGDSELIIRAARPVNEARDGDITFIDSPRQADRLKDCRASAAVIPASVPVNGLPAIQVKDALAAFITIVRHLHGRPEPAVHGIDVRAVVHPTATIGLDASVHAFAVIGEGTTIGARCRIHSGAVVGRFCRLGDDVTLNPNCVLYDDTVLGHRVIVHANSVVGADGFGYRLQEGKHVKVPHLGSVEIGDDVEIGSCTTIDRGTFHATRIGAGTKIDNLVQVAHNCQIGQHNLLVGQVGIAGSSSTGDYVVIAGQVGVADHIHIGTGAIVGAQAGVTRDVPDGQRVFGAPAMIDRVAKRMIVSMVKLPDIIHDIKRIKKHLGIAETGRAER